MCATIELQSANIMQNPGTLPHMQIGLLLVGDPGGRIHVKKSEAMQTSPAVELRMKIRGPARQFE
jgi:hypothetical protein